MSGLTIGQVAEMSDVNVETIRFYERTGLIQQPAKPLRHFRQYPPDVVDRVLFIRQAKELGFTLKDIAKLLDMQAIPDGSSAEVLQFAEDKIAEVDAKIRNLKQMKKMLVQLTATCDGAGTLSQCPILAALDKNKGK